MGYLAAFSVFFPLAMVLVGVVTWVLMEIRDPLRQVLGLLQPIHIAHPAKWLVAGDTLYASATLAGALRTSMWADRRKDS